MQALGVMLNLHVSHGWTMQFSQRLGREAWTRLIHVSVPRVVHHWQCATILWWPLLFSWVGNTVQSILTFLLGVMRIGLLIAE